MQKYLPACFHIFLFLACKGTLGWPSWGWCHGKPQWELPKNPAPLSMPGAGTAPGPPAACGRNPRAWPGWAGLEAVPGGQAGSAELRLALYANGSAIIPLEFITVTLFAIGSFSVTNASVGFFYCDLINNEWFCLERRRTRGFKAGAGVTANVARLLRAVTNAPANDAQPHGQGRARALQAPHSSPWGHPPSVPASWAAAAPAFSLFRALFFLWRQQIRADSSTKTKVEHWPCLKQEKLQQIFGRILSQFSLTSNIFGYCKGIQEEKIFTDRKSSLFYLK